MKSLYPVMVFCLGMALAQEPAQPHADLGDATLQDFELHGPVREVKTCFLAAEYCEIQHFNRAGVSVAELDARALLAAGEGTVVFERKTNHGKIIDTYQNGLLVLQEEEGGDIPSTRRVLEYGPDRLPSKESIFRQQGGEFRLEAVNLFTYQEGRLVSVAAADGSFEVQYNLQGARVSERSVMDGETFLIEYTYAYDPQGNWIRRFEDGEATIQREILYW